MQGKCIVKGALALAATAAFVYLYSLIHTDAEHKHAHTVRASVDMTKIYFSFASFLLFLMGFPILR